MNTAGHHIRFTPYREVFQEDIEEFGNHYSKCIVGFEHKDKKGKDTEPHYHIYFETDTIPDTIRNRFKRIMRIPAGQKGRANKYFALSLNWSRPEYVCKMGEIVYKKGYSDDEIAEFVKVGAEKWLKEENLKEKIPEHEAAPPAEKKKEKCSEWDILICYFTAMPPLERPGTIFGYKQKICYKFIKEMRPIPRKGDLERYSFSLYAWFMAARNESDEKLNTIINEYLAMDHRAL